LFLSFSFREGNYCTKFIAEEYPKGFSNVDLSPGETLEMIATAVILDQVKYYHQFGLNSRISPMINTEGGVGEDTTRVVAVLEDGKAFEVSVTMEGKDIQTKIIPLDENGRHSKEKVSFSFCFCCV
jgi:hypothetical protein